MPPPSPFEIEKIDGLAARHHLEALAHVHPFVALTDSHGTVRWTSPLLEKISDGNHESETLAYLCASLLACLRGDVAPRPSQRSTEVDRLGKVLEPVLAAVAVEGRSSHHALDSSVDEAEDLEALRVDLSAYAVTLTEAVRCGSMASIRAQTRDSTAREHHCVIIFRPHTIATKHEANPARIAEAPAGFFADVVDQLPDATITTDAAGFITSANHQATQLLGTPRAELLDAPVAAFVPGEAIVRMGTTGEAEVSGSSHPIVEIASSGTLVEFACRPLGGPDADFHGYLLQLRDHTQQQRTTERFKQKIASLESFAHTVAHDLRSPLVSLLGFTHLLQQDYGSRLDETGRRFLDRIEQASRNMNTMTRDLLELSTRGPSARCKREDVDPRNVLLQLQSELKSDLEARNIELVLPAAPPVIACDRTQLYQIFSNLVGNAVRHMGPCDDARIEVDIHESANHCMIVVSDNGRGIDASLHERIFDASHSHSADESRPSSGFGLSIVKKIAAAHGGRVEIDSRVGCGARFTVSLEHP